MAIGCPDLTEGADIFGTGVATWISVLVDFTLGETGKYAHVR
jgi:hypothetical protein